MVFQEGQIMSLITLLSSFSYLTSFLAPFIGGEIAVIFLAFLGSQGYFSFFSVVFFSWLGMITLDSFWFLLVRTGFIQKIKKYKRVAKYNLKFEKHLETISGNRDILILLISKILIGTRILILIYLSLRKINFRKFLLYNSVSTFIWAIILVSIGWFSGESFSLVLERFNDLKIALLFLAIFFVGVYLISKKIRNWLTYRREEIKI